MAAATAVMAAMTVVADMAAMTAAAADTTAGATAVAAVAEATVLNVVLRAHMQLAHLVPGHMTGVEVDQDLAGALGRLVVLVTLQS